jgi:hypothetical protein
MINLVRSLQQIPFIKQVDRFLQTHQVGLEKHINKSPIGNTVSGEIYSCLEITSF